MSFLINSKQSFFIIGGDFQIGQKIMVKLMNGMKTQAEVTAKGPQQVFKVSMNFSIQFYFFITEPPSPIGPLDNGLTC